MGEPPLPPAPIRELQQAEPDGPRVWAKHVLVDLGICSSNEKYAPPLLDYLVPQMFSPLMLQPARTLEVPPGYYELQADRPGQLNPRYQEHVPGPLMVLSSGIQSSLVKAGYQKVTSFDLNRLWNVNGVGSLYGDKYLKDVCQVVLEELGEGQYLVRNNNEGDEFSIYARDVKEYDTVDIFKKIEAAVRERVVIPVKEALVIYPQRASISPKKTPDASARRPLTSEEEAEVSAYLSEHHPEVAEHILYKPELLSLIRDFVQDPVLGDKAKERGIRVYLNGTDFFTRLEGRPGVRQLLRYETSGGKYANDKTKDYEEGNALLRFGFDHLIRSLREVGITDLTDITILRQGGNFTVDLGTKLYDLALVREELGKKTGRYTGGQFAEEGIPFIPAVSTALVDFKAGLIDGVAVPKEEKITNKVQSKLQKEAMSDKSRAFRDYYRSKADGDGDWRFLAYQINPFSNRGFTYAVEFGVEGAKMDTLRRMYDQLDRDEGMEFVPEKLPAFVSFMKEKVFA